MGHAALPVGRGFAGLGTLARALATACMGDNHLWQDTGLPHRQALSRAIGAHFTSLARANAGDMRWKKFLYRPLCEKAEVLICKSPSCAECVDMPRCFPRDGTGFVAAAPPLARG